MAITELKKEDIINALSYIDNNQVPLKNESSTYELVTEDGSKYPLKYVIAVADHLANGTDIKTGAFNSIEANNLLKRFGYKIEVKQEKFELVITADSVVSTDKRFSINNISAGDNYKPIKVHFEKEDGKSIFRRYEKGERKNSNQTMPRLACQIFEQQLVNLSVEEKENFPVCQYTPESEIIRGIYSSIADFRKYRNTIEYVKYYYGNERQFVFYCWNIFSTIIFVQECLKRFGEKNDKFVLIYREKDKIEADIEEKDARVEVEEVKKIAEYVNPYSPKLIKSKNIILHGAPGTGKSYLAKEIAADIVSDGYYNDYELLSDEQKSQIGFVQFHPSYDYSDFVEGLRPIINSDGTMGFELKDGIFELVNS